MERTSSKKKNFIGEKIGERNVQGLYHAQTADHDANGICLPEFCYLAFFAIMIGAKGMGLYDGQLLYKLCLVVSLFFVLLKMACEEHSMGELLAYAILFPMIGVIYLVTDNKGYIIYLFMFLGMKNVSVKRLFKVGTWSLSVTLLLNFLLAQLGLHEGKIFLHDKLGGEILRYGFGHSHTNVMHMTYVILCYMILYLVKEDRKKLLKWNVGLFIGSILIFVFSISYTGVILSLGLFIMTLYYCLVPQKIYLVEKILYYMVTCVCIFCATILPFFLFQNKPLFEKVNAILHNRLLVFFSYFSVYSVKPFGQNISDLSVFEDAFYQYQLDNSFTTLLLEGGGILFVVITVGILFTIGGMMKRGMKFELIILLLTLYGGETDPYLFNTSFKNLMFVWMGMLFYEVINNSVGYSYVTNDANSGSVAETEGDTGNGMTSKKWLLGQMVYRNPLTKWAQQVMIPNLQRTTNAEKLVNADSHRGQLSHLVVIGLSIAISGLVIGTHHFPTGYGVVATACEISAENNADIREGLYSYVAEQKDVKIYGTKDLSQPVVYFETTRMQQIEKVRYMLLCLVESFALLEVAYWGFGKIKKKV